MKGTENEILLAESVKRENDAILKVLEIVESCPVPVTHTQVFRRICKENAFLGVRKLGSWFLLILDEHNQCKQFGQHNANNP